jgi:hypothetical protein
MMIAASAGVYRSACIARAYRRYGQHLNIFPPRKATFAKRRVEWSVNSAGGFPQRRQAFLSVHTVNPLTSASLQRLKQVKRRGDHISVSALLLPARVDGCNALPMAVFYLNRSLGKLPRPRAWRVLLGHGRPFVLFSKFRPHSQHDISQFNALCRSQGGV